MKLNLWMIVNRLYQMDPEMNIPEDAPINLQSARLSATPHCVYVYQKGEDVFCDAGKDGGYIVFRKENYLQIYDIIQATFDFYQDWEQMLEKAKEHLDYEMAMSKSWILFHNPMVLLDGSNKVLSMSSQYDEENVNNDWSYLREHGHSSVQVIEYLMDEGRHNRYYLNRKAQIYHFYDHNIHMYMISYALFWKENSIGRINVLEYERELNIGDVQLVEFLSRFLVEILGRLTEQDDQTGTLMHYFTRMLLGQTVSDTELEYWKKYVHWLPEKDYRICVIIFREELSVPNVISIRNMIQNSIPQVLAVIHGGNIVFSVSDAQLEYLYRGKILEELYAHVRFLAGVSLPYRQVKDIPYAFGQACKAAEYSVEKDKMVLADFYLYAVRYLVENAMDASFCHACHPDILNLYSQMVDEKNEMAETYYRYLQNHRSVSQTARDLQIHKNTLIYRIRRIEDAFQYDDASVYTREYMLLSMYILHLNDTTEQKILDRMNKCDYD